VPLLGRTRLKGLLIFKDISLLSRSDKQITSLPPHDMLTGLYSRFKFEEVVSSLIDSLKAKTNVLSSRKRSAPYAVFYVGLGHFSHTYKGLWHNAGDKLLKGVTHRLKNCISDFDIAARLGGDEFTIALTQMYDATMRARWRENFFVVSRNHSSLRVMKFTPGHASGLPPIPSAETPLAIS
jgi:Amt family ammonium transporter